jgi:hypothetical protein
MIVTEEEAKTKRCQESFGDGFVSSMQSAMAMPMARAAYSSPSHCIGAACMAWRWRGWRDKEARLFGDATEHGTGPTERVGYCGKAGKP